MSGESETPDMRRLAASEFAVEDPPSYRSRDDPVHAGEDHDLDGAPTTAARRPAAALRPSSDGLESNTAARATVTEGVTDAGAISARATSPTPPPEAFQTISRVKVTPIPHRDGSPTDGPGRPR